jgi:hypothetical protein
VNFDQIYQEWKSVHYAWLPTAEELSKSLGEKVPHEVLEKLDVRTNANTPKLHDTLCDHKMELSSSLPPVVF